MAWIRDALHRDALHRDHRRPACRRAGDGDGGRGAGNGDCYGLADHGLAHLDATAVGCGGGALLRGPPLLLMQGLQPRPLAAFPVDVDPQHRRDYDCRLPHAPVRHDKQ